MNDITVFAQEQDNIFKDITSFDFGSLNSQDAAFIAKNHQEIISVCEQGTLMVGERLSKIKETLKGQHGRQGWYAYLEHTPWNAKQADRFIAEYENPEKFSLYKLNFGEYSARRLLRAPESVQDEIMKRVDDGEKINTKKINDAIRRAKEAEKRAEEAEQKARSLEQYMNQEPQVIEKEIVKEVVKEVIPDDYEALKEKEAILKNATDELSRIKAQAENEKKVAEDKLSKIDELIATKQETLEEFQKRIKLVSKQFDEECAKTKDYHTDLATLSSIADSLGMARSLVEFNKGRWGLQHPRVRENIDACIAYTRELTRSLEDEITNYRGENYELSTIVSY